MIEASADALGAEEVLSHVSAAVLHGLPVWDIPLGRVHITKSRSSGGHRNSRLHTHPAPLDPAEVTTVGRYLVTSVARTVVDLARASGFEQEVVVADAALHRGLVQPAELQAELAKVHRRHGASMARQVVAFASPLSESVGESRSRVLFDRHGLPRPTEQFEVVDADGHPCGRADFAWEDGRLVGEFDGYVKYEKLLRPGESSGQAVFREKRREDSFREAGSVVIRWVWADLDEPAALVRRLGRALKKL
ncbi:hypothetical protein D1871_17715 [Nakamurella silvestris]|nr:hypothetical protein D1871_17715 [Nakamurella silvestris]